MQRICIENLTFSNTIEIKDKDIINQIVKVLRSKEGDEIIFFSWNDNLDYKYQIISIEKKEVKFKRSLEITKPLEKDIINLFVWIPNKLEKIELILQKWVEIGVSKFTFFKAERSQKLNLSDNKMLRLKKIIVEAIEQSGRNIVPELHFADSLNYPDSWYFFHTENSSSKGVFECWFDEDKTNLFVGPEGWFTSEEIKKFTDKWYSRVHLWNNILRCETCAIVVPFFVKQSKEKS